MLLELVLGFFASLRGAQAYEALFLLLFLCGLGMPLSQDMLLLAAAGSTLFGALAPAPLLAVAVLGLLAGDAVTFWIGRHWGARWVRRPWAARFVPAERLPAWEQAAHRHALPFSFLTRFLPGQRSTLFFAGGTLRMPWGRFLVGDGLGAIVHAGLLLYGARALGWGWSRWRDPFDQADNVLTGILLLAVLAWLWTQGRRRMLPAAAAPSATAAGELAMELSSTGIVGGRIAQVHACRGKGGRDLPPQLALRAIPAQGRSLAIVADDPDARKQAGRVWVPWNVFNVPVTGREMEFAAGQALPGDAGHTSGGARGYEGMCPPDGVHRYRFAVFALKDRLAIDTNAPWTIAAFERKYGSEVVAKAEIGGRF